MLAGVSDGGGEILEHVVAGSDRRKCPDGGQQPDVLGAGTLEKDGDATLVELLGDLAEGARAGRVEHPDGAETQDDDSDVGDSGDLGEEAGRSGEEQRSVEAVDEHVRGKQRVLGCVVDPVVGEQLGLSALTVKSHLARIARKLGTGDRAEMVAMAMRAGVVR